MFFLNTDKEKRESSIKVVEKVIKEHGFDVSRVERSANK